jgi:hypothetical protein
VRFGGATTGAATGGPAGFDPVFCEDGTFFFGVRADSGARVVAGSGCLDVEVVGVVGDGGGLPAAP